jgi:hypothetical protein
MRKNYGPPKVIKCIQCGKDFTVANWRIGKAKYCSYTCSFAGSKSEKSYDKPRKCIGCGEKFIPTGWSQKYCSRKCFCESVKKTGLKKCKNCGKEFKQVRLGQIYCSRKCFHPLKNKLNKKPKQEALDRTWSEAVKRKANNKCEYCGKTTGLNSHHIFSRSNKRVRWDINNGICVCVLHHVFGLFSAHKSPIEFVEWLKEYRGVDWYEELRKKAKFTDKFIKPSKEEEQVIREGLMKIKVNNAL